jgi:putative transposase
MVIGVRKPRSRAACRAYRLHQEFITPYPPEQNSIIERFFRSLKEECAWQPLFPCFGAARRGIAARIRWYKEVRPHQSLGLRSPREHRAQQGQLVA